MSVADELDEPDAPLEPARVGLSEPPPAADGVEWVPVAGPPPMERQELVEVTVQPNESIDNALKRFNQKVQQAGVLRRLKEKAYYEKPSEQRRRRSRRPMR